MGETRHTLKGERLPSDLLRVSFGHASASYLQGAAAESANEKASRVLKFGDQLGHGYEIFDKAGGFGATSFFVGSAEQGGGMDGGHHVRR